MCYLELNVNIQASTAPPTPFSEIPVPISKHFPLFQRQELYPASLRHFYEIQNCEQNVQENEQIFELSG